MPRRRRRNRTATPLQRQIDRTTNVYAGRTSLARRNARGARATSTLRGAVNARFTSNTNANGQRVYSRRTGQVIGTMVKNAG